MGAKKGEALGAKGKADKKGKKPSRPRRKLFNLFTYKLHALGDYVATIQRYDTTDNYNTQLVCSHFNGLRKKLTDLAQGELEHRRVK
jgi:hypothetical protein